MNQSLSHNDSWSLIGKVLAQEASDDELADFERWLAADPKHKADFDFAEAFWQQHRKLPPQAVDIDAAWRKLDQRIAPQATVRPLFRRPAFYVSALAAAFAILLMLWQPWRSTPTYQQLRTQQAELAELKLNDGSQIWLNKASQLSYPAAMRGEERRVMLKGEAFFEVARDEQRPFVIEAGDARIQVLGTSFNIRAYPNESQVELSVKSGKVLFFKGEKLLPDSSNAKILVAGQQAVIERSKAQPDMLAKAQSNYLAWRDKKLIFDHAPLTEVIPILERYYGVKFELKAAQLENIRFHSDSAFEQVSLDAILQEIEMANPGIISFQEKDGGYLVK